MLLVDKGKLNLDYPASRYMKDLPRKWDGITVRQFMTHTSGIPELPNRQKKQEATIEEAFTLAAGLPMSFQIMAVVLGIKDVGRGAGGDDQGQ